MITRLLQAGIMGAWATFFTWLFAVEQPTLARLLHPRLWWLVLAGAVVLLIFLGVALRRIKMPTAQPLRWSWPAYLILLVPLCFVGQMQSARFDSQTFRDRSPSAIETMATVQEQEIQQATPETPDIATPVEESFIQIAQDPQRHVGRRVELLCQALPDTRLPDDQFICYRFRINCCAADAQPVFIFVNRQGSPPPAKDAWMRVKGRLSPHTVNGLTFALIQAESLQSEAEPSFPFIF